MAQVIKVDGTTEEITDLSLKGMQEAVGGYIEMVSTPNGKVLIVDEEGKLKNKEVNLKATTIYGNPNDVIVGDCILADNNEIS